MLLIITITHQSATESWVPEGKFRHSDHRFEWTRQQFQDWANRIVKQYGYTVQFSPAGDESEEKWSKKFPRLSELADEFSEFSAYGGWFDNLPKKVYANELSYEAFEQLESELTALPSIVWDKYKSEIKRNKKDNRGKLISTFDEAAGYAFLKTTLSEKQISFDDIKQPETKETKTSDWVALSGGSIVAALEVKTFFNSDKQNEYIKSNTKKLQNGDLPKVKRINPQIPQGLLNKLKCSFEKASGQLKAVEDQPKLLIIYFRIHIDHETAQLPKYKTKIRNYLKYLKYLNYLQDITDTSITVESEFFSY